MAGVNFFQSPQDGNMAGGWGVPPDGDPNDQAFQQRRGMAQALLRQMPTSQGQMVNGHYVAPTGSEYAMKIAQALQQGQQNFKRQDTARTMGVLNGGESALVNGQAPQLPLQKMGGWLSGLFGGGQ